MQIIFFDEQTSDEIGQEARKCEFGWHIKREEKEVCLYCQHGI